MARPRLQVPNLRTHAPTNQAVVRIDGKDHYLGKAGSEKAQARYDALVAEWLTSGRQLAGTTPGPKGTDLLIGELGLLWFRHADSYYRRDGKPTDEPGALKLAFRPLRKLYGLTPAREFSPLKLKAVRKQLIEGGLSRPEINKRIGRILRMFRWAVSEELVPVEVLTALEAVEGLKKERTTAPEPEPILPVDWRLVDVTIPLLSPPVRAIVELLRYTGARISEVASMRTGGIDASGPVWKYRPEYHKKSHEERQRTFYLGPKAQEVVRPWLKPGEPDAYLFSPKEAMQARWAEQRAKRKTKVQPSQRDRKREKKIRSLGETYHRRAIYHAVQQAVKKYNRETKAGGLDRPELAAWHPYQIRHTVGTEVRAKYGLEAAQVILGHAKADVTQVYAERDEAKALGIIADIG